MKKILLTLLALIATVSAATAASGIDWSSYDWIGNGSSNSNYTEKFKVSTVDGISVVNIQQPDWVSEPGIYVTAPAAISTCSVSNTINGAGAILYCSAFTSQETEVTLTCNGSTYTFWVYYADGTAEGETVAVTGVSLPATATVGVGKTTTLTATFAPTNATNKNVTWASDAESIATVDANGVVTGVAVGTANITVTTEDGNYTASCTVTVSNRPTADATTWNSNDTNVASGCDVWVSAIFSGDKSYITDNAIGNACQLLVNDSQPTEWFVVDLGYSYNVTKISLVTTGDRKDKEFEIYYASAQDTEPAFADGTDALDDNWTMAYYATDDYENTGVGYNTYAVSLSGVRYIKYVGSTRNHNDTYGTGIVELYVAGSTNDASATVATAINATAPTVWTNKTAALSYSVVNSKGNALTVDATKLGATSSNESVATVAVDGTAISVTGVAEGSATITISYDELSTTVDVDVHTLTAAPTPTQSADSVLSLYSDTYTTGVANYGWYDWGGCSIAEEQIADGDNVRHLTGYKYCGSQFDKTDVSEYTYFHIDIYPTVATTIGIVPITRTTEDNANTPERGVTTATLTAFAWNSLDIAMSDFTTNGVTNLDLLYQIKYNKSVSADGAEVNCDGTPELYIDNVYFYKSDDTSGINSISVDNSADIEYYNLQGVRVANPENGIYIRRQGNSVSKVLVK